VVETPGPSQNEMVFSEVADTVESSQDSELVDDSSSTAAPRSKAWRVWIWLAVAVFLIFQVYYVREMLAVLVIFAGLFFVVAIIAAIIYAVGRAGESTITAAEPMARRGMELAEEVSKKTFRRPRSAPVP
jgi:hypothetical protein